MASTILARSDAHDARTPDLFGSAKAASIDCSLPRLRPAETIIFLIEARADFLQGITVRSDEPSDERQAEGYKAFGVMPVRWRRARARRPSWACWLRGASSTRCNDRSDCALLGRRAGRLPNVTIRNRSARARPRGGEASLYRTRDLVPAHLMPDSPKAVCSSRTGTCSSRRESPGRRRRARRYSRLAFQSA